MGKGIDPYAALVITLPGMPTTVQSLSTSRTTTDHADAGVFADRDRAQHLRSGAHHNILGQGWVAFAVFLPVPPRVTPWYSSNGGRFRRFRRLPLHAMVNEHAMADAGAGVDLDAGGGTADLAEAAGSQLQGRRQSRGDG